MTMTRNAARPALAAVLLAVAACSRGPHPPAPDASEPRHEGAVPVPQTGPVQLRPGERFEVVLASNATTGYQWQLADSALGGVVALVGSDYRADPAPPGIAGAGGKEHWTFRGVKPGEVGVRMVYVRPWEKGKEPAEDTTFQVIVR